MDPHSSIFSLILVFLGIAVFYGIVVLGHYSIISLNDNELAKEIDDGNKKAKLIGKIIEKPTRFILSMQVVECFCSMFIAAFLSSAIATSVFAKLPDFRNVQPRIVYVILLLAITVVIGVVTIVLSQLVPKKLAVNNPRAIAYALAPIMRAVYWIVFPFVSFVSFLSKIVVGIFGVNIDETEKNVTEEEIRMMIDAGNEKGTIEQSERDMIDNIFEFDDNDVQKVMTHRTEMVALQKDVSVVEAVKTAVAEGYSRIPVYDEDIDDIVGILYAKDLLPLVGDANAKNITISNFLRPIIFVPESKRCDDLFKIFQARKIQVAIVVDEYGGTSGLVSMEDLLEAIVGNIQDEYDDEEELFKKVSDNCYIFDGSIDIEDFEKIASVDIPNEYEECETLGGLITDMLDRIPEEKEHPEVSFSNAVLKVLKVEDRRIAKVKCEIKPLEA
ncbi:MAG: hemolysin family protein [Oscillospiraceae bacterium]